MAVLFSQVDFKSCVTTGVFRVSAEVISEQQLDFEKMAAGFHYVQVMGVLIFHNTV